MPKKNISHLAFVIFALFPLVAQANLSPIERDDFSLMFNSITLWLAVTIGIIATASVFWDARQFRGGQLEKVYFYFGFGMFLLLSGMVVLIVKPWDIDFILLDWKGLGQYKKKVKNLLSEINIPFKKTKEIEKYR